MSNRDCLSASLWRDGVAAVVVGEVRGRTESLAWLGWGRSGLAEKRQSWPRDRYSGGNALHAGNAVCRRNNWSKRQRTAVRVTAKNSGWETRLNSAGGVAVVVSELELELFVHRREVRCEHSPAASPYRDHVREGCLFPPMYCSPRGPMQPSPPVHTLNITITSSTSPTPSTQPVRPWLPLSRPSTKTSPGACPRSR
jgi:hypothetical protein